MTNYNTQIIDIEKLIKTIIDAAYKVRDNFLPGYLESIYENALIVELEDLGLKVESQKPLTVTSKIEQLANLN